MGTPNGFQICFHQWDGWKCFPHKKICKLLISHERTSSCVVNLSFCFVTLLTSTKCFTSQYNKRQQLMVIGFNSL
nr:MAG TPA: hypothetical protein [Bacteriophage sp.]